MKGGGYLCSERQVTREHYAESNWTLPNSANSIRVDVKWFYNGMYSGNQCALEDTSPQSRWGTETEIESEFDALMSQIQ